jgi:glutathione S-transferase
MLNLHIEGVRPIQGQAHSFESYASEKIEYGITHYTNETKYLFNVLKSRLQGYNYLVEEQLTIVDISCPLGY